MNWFSKDIMIRRVDRSMTKIYKDLIVSKRELSDIRQSISKTLHALRLAKKDSTLAMKKKICSLCGVSHNFPPSPDCGTLVFTCQYCMQQFCATDLLDKHIRIYHSICNFCQNNQQQRKVNKENEVQGQRRVECERCGARIKRKQIEIHVMRCCFKDCKQCQKKVYYKAFSYHIKICKEDQKKANRPRPDTKKQKEKEEIRKVPINQQDGHPGKAFYFPYSILRS